MPVLSVDVWGGGNWRDQPWEIFNRSHAAGPRGFSQQAPLEAQDLQNVDFLKRAVGKRLGSASDDDSSGVHASGETILEAFYISGTEVQVGVKSIYIKTSGGSWTRATASSNDGGGDFSWASDNTKIGVAFLDGYAWVGGDGSSNYIQIVSPGSTTLQDEANNDGTNVYTNPTDSSTNAFAGTWPQGIYQLASFQNRLVMGKGENWVEFTPPLTVGVYDLSDATAGFWRAQGNIIAITSFIPRTANELLQRLVIFTEDGPELLSGFTVDDVPFLMEGAGVPVSHRAVAVTQNWVMYLTEQQTIEALNMFRFIDAGRRMLNGDGSTGPLDSDNFDPTNSNHATETFAFYNRAKRQFQVYCPDGSTRSTNSQAFVVDMDFGEPGAQETQGEYERHVRNLWHTIKEPGTNAWFVAMYQRKNSTIGVTSDGQTWVVGSGTDDLGTIPVEDYDKFLPDFDGGATSNVKTFGVAYFHFLQRGDWDVDLLRFVDRATNSTGSTITMKQVAEGAAVYDTAQYDSDSYANLGADIAHTVQLDIVGHYLALQIQNQRSNEDWVLTSVQIPYKIGSVQT